MKYDPQKHHRRSIRLQGYDYTQAGAYFITICTQDRLCLFGEIINGEMRSNAHGQIVYEEWFRSARIRRGIRLQPDEFVVMPNHLHGIIWIVADPNDVGTRRRRTPTIERFGKPVPGSIPTIVRSFKSATACRINQRRGTPGTPIWQRNYYEHVIRNDESLNRIRLYIAENPLRWAVDHNNPRVVTSEPEETWQT